MGKERHKSRRGREDNLQALERAMFLKAEAQLMIDIRINKQGAILLSFMLRQAGGEL